MSDYDYAAANEEARKELWSTTKDVWDRYYSDARKIGMDVDAATEHADDRYDERFGLTAGTPDYTAALVELALNPELATPAPSVFPRPTLDQALEAQRAADAAVAPAPTAAGPVTPELPEEAPALTTHSRLLALAANRGTGSAGTSADKLEELARRRQAALQQPITGDAATVRREQLDGPAR